MCVMSAIGDYWQHELPQKTYWPSVSNPEIPISRAEFDALKRDVEELKKLLLAAKKYDEATGQPDCETDAKVALIRKVAELVGVSMEDVFGPKA